MYLGMTMINRICVGSDLWRN